MFIYVFHLNKLFIKCIFIWVNQKNRLVYIKFNYLKLIAQKINSNNLFQIYTVGSVLVLMCYLRIMYLDKIGIFGGHKCKLILA